MRRILGLLLLLLGCGSDAQEAPPREAPVASTRPDAAPPAPELVDRGDPPGDTGGDPPGDAGAASAVRDRPDAAPGDEVPDVAVVGPKMLELFELLATAATEAKGDCDRIAATFRVIFEEHEALLRQAGKIEKHREAYQAWKERFGEARDEVKKRIAEGIKPCVQSDALAAVFDEL